jgi:hypothetical protein
VGQNDKRLTQIIGLEHAAMRRRDAKKRQESWRDVGHVDPLGRTEFRERQMCAIGRFQSRQRSRTLPPGFERGIPHRAGRWSGIAGRTLAECDESLGLVEWRWREQHGVDDGEDRSAGAKRQRQRQDGGCRAGW